MNTPTMNEQTLGGGFKAVTAQVDVQFGSLTMPVGVSTIVADTVHLMPVVERSGIGVTLQLVGNPDRGHIWAHTFQVDPTQTPPCEPGDADAQEADDEGDQPDWWDE